MIFMSLPQLIIYVYYRITVIKICAEDWTKIFITLHIATAEPNFKHLITVCVHPAHTSAMLPMSLATERQQHNIYTGIYWEWGRECDDIHTVCALCVHTKWPLNAVSTDRRSRRAWEEHRWMSRNVFAELFNTSLCFTWRSSRFHIIAFVLRGASHFSRCCH